MNHLPWHFQGVTSRAPLRTPMIALLALALALSGAIYPFAANAQSQPSASLTLRQAYEAAVARQPETRSAPQRRDAAAAHQRTAQAWTPEPPAFEGSLKTDRIGSNKGSREWVVGVAVPLWLPGQRHAAMSLAQAEFSAVDQALTAASWRVAGEVRDAWWTGHLAQVDLDLAQTRLGNAERLAADVALRVRAGDLARADQHQAGAAVAAAQAELASIKTAQAQAMLLLRRLAGPLASAALATAPEPLPDDGAALDSLIAAHPAIRDATSRAEVARRAGAQARLQGRAAPELALAATRGRGDVGEAYGQSITIGLRIPFGADDRQQARLASAGAELTEAETRLAAERERIEADMAFARERLALARSMADASERRATLARESLGFLDKAFRLGEIDLPARLRIALEAMEAERQNARARIEVAQAISQWRQALGLSPV